MCLTHMPVKDSGSATWKGSGETKFCNLGGTKGTFQLGGGHFSCCFGLFVALPPDFPPFIKLLLLLEMGLAFIFHYAIGCSPILFKNIRYIFFVYCLDFFQSLELLYIAHDSLGCSVVVENPEKSENTATLH